MQSETDVYILRAKSIERAKDAESAELLNELIMEMSEEMYSAGWMRNIEFELWKALKIGSNKHYNNYVKQNLPYLKELSEKAGGWWYWDDKINIDLFIPMTEWEAMYAARS